MGGCPGISRSRLACKNHPEIVGRHGWLFDGGDQRFDSFVGVYYRTLILDNPPL